MIAVSLCRNIFYKIHPFNPESYPSEGIFTTCQELLQGFTSTKANKKIPPFRFLYRK